MKKLISILAILALMLVAVACAAQPAPGSAAAPNGNATSTPAPAPAEGTAPGAEARTIGGIIIRGTNPHCAAFGEGFVKAVEAHGDTAILLDAEANAEKMVNCISDLISQGVDGIVLEACDAEAAISILKEAKDAGIPVAAADLFLSTTEEDGLVISQTVSENYDAGAQCAEDLIRRANGEDTNVLVMEVKQDSSGVMRVEGFLDTVSGHDNIHILEVGQPKANSVEEKLALADIWCQKYDDIDAIFVFHDTGALAAIQALKSAGRLEGTFVYAVDGTPDGLAAVKAGELTGTSKQQPAELARLATEDIYTILNGSPIGHAWEVRVPTVFVDASNVAEFLS